MRLASLLQVRTGYVAATLVVVITSLLFVGFRSGHKEPFLPGITSDGHHLQEAACQSCHDGFHGAPNDKCLGCHRDSLEHDTHAAAMFDDPRWAGALEKLDATKCASCHKEHRVARDGVTVEASFCFGCHDDVVSRRASHASFASDSCGRGGCHEYHDNSGLNVAYLKAHAREPDSLPKPTRLVWGSPPQGPPAIPDRPVEAAADAAIASAWQTSGHADARVNCMDCHKGQGGSFTRSPGTSACKACHEREAGSYGSGKHGVRETVGLAPLTPVLARLSMRPTTAPQSMSCTTCHDAHSVDTRKASVQACLQCHDDSHSRAYRDSKHAGIADGMAGSRSSPEAVTCATCHMPRETVIDNGKARVAVNHDVGRWLHPRSRMGKAVCMNCHGLDLTLSSIFDDGVVTSNFQRRPSAQHPTIGMIDALVPRNAEKGAQP